MIAGAMGWTPDTLYRATLPELLAHYDGWLKANGADGKTAAVPATHADPRVQALMAKHG